MIAIIPLAGPDFDHPALPTLKPLYPVDGVPLLRRTLESRPWWRSGELTAAGLVFVLRASPRAPEFHNWLLSTYPGCRTVILSHPTCGALVSVLSGTTVIADWTAPLVIDLVDIHYSSDSTESFTSQLAKDARLGAIVPVFSGSDPRYSYAALDPADPAGRRISRTAEKQVISPWASAGTYVFRNTAIFLQAAARCLAGGEKNAVHGSFFVCPAINDLIALGWDAVIEPVTLLDSAGTILKDRMAEVAAPDR